MGVVMHLEGYNSGLTNGYANRYSVDFMRKRKKPFPIFGYIVCILLGVILALSSYSTANTGKNVGLNGSLQPYVIYGYVYYPNGTPVANAKVNVTDAATGEWTINYTNSEGYYQVDLANFANYSNGDVIYVNVSANGYWGSNTTTVNTSIPSKQVDVYIQPVDELSTLLIVAGIPAIFILVRKEVIK